MISITIFLYLMTIFITFYAMLVIFAVFVQLVGWPLRKFWDKIGSINKLKYKKNDSQL